MGSSTKRRIGGALVALVLGSVVLAGCGDDDDDATGGASPSPSASEAPADGELSVTATDYAFDGMPATVEGGVVTVELVNDGEQPHELGLMHLDRAMTPEEFDETISPVFEGGAFPDAILGHAGITELEPGESLTSTFSLPEGTYALYCSISDEGGDEEDEGGGEGEEQQAPPHYELGMYQVVEVEGDNGAALPEDTVLTATDYEFDIPELAAGEQELTFRNDSERQFHHAVLFEWPEGVDEAAAAEAWETLSSMEEGTPPPEGTPEPEDIAGSQVFGPGTGGTFRTELTTGRTYSVLCFLPDREGGPPHAFGHGMVQHFTVG